MDPYRTAPTLPLNLTRFKVMTFLSTVGRVLKRYAAGIIPIGMIFLSFRTGRYVWCEILDHKDVSKDRSEWSDPTPWYIFVWFFGLAIITSPIWVPRLGNWIINLLWPKKETA